jgi:hypothetical protein
MDVVLPTTEPARTIEAMQIEAITHDITEEERGALMQRVNRVGRFLQRIGEQAQGQSTTVGSVLTEEDLRRICET